MKNLSDCRVLLVDDAKANLDILVEGLKADHKLSRAMIIELRDSGVAFDPTLAATSDGIAADDEPPGGWGIFLVRKYTDEMHYVRDRGENVLRLIKRLTPLS